jgi:hypothetical protein
LPQAVLIALGTEGAIGLALIEQVIHNPSQLMGRGGNGRLGSLAGPDAAVRGPPQPITSGDLLA